MSGFDSLLINGDSYSAVTADIPKVYGNYLSESLSVPCYNYASQGSSNDRIIRTTIEYVNRHLERGHTPLVIVGLSFIRRVEVWYYGDKKVYTHDSTNLPSSPKLVTLDFLLNQGLATVEQKSMVLPDFEIHKKLTDFYTDLYLLANWLEKKNLSYLFFSAAKNTDCPSECFPYIHSLSTTQWCINNPKIYRPHNFCIMDWAQENDRDHDKQTGHLSAKGHENFSAMIKNILEEVNGTV